MGEEALGQRSCVDCQTVYALYTASTSGFTRATGEWVCDSCVRQYYISCGCCNMLVHEDSTTEVYNGERVDAGCLRVHYFRCDHCRAYYGTDDRYNGPNGEAYCGDCWGEDCCSCNECGVTMWRDDTSWDEGGDSWCSRCYNERFYWCGDCDGEYLQNNPCPCRTEENAEDDEPRPVATRIHVHSYRPPTPHTVMGSKERAASLFLGWELEVEHNMTQVRANPNAYEAGHTKPWIYCKSDGSLDATGLELVSHPFSYAAIKERRQELSEWLETLVSGGARVSDRCGMHVHVSAEYCTPSILYKMSNLVYNHPNWVRQMSGRVSDAAVNQYTRMDVMPSTWKRLTLNRMGARYNRRETQVYDFSLAHPRYMALNLVGRPSTVEFRLFQSTLQKEVFFRNLEFAAAIPQYAAQAFLKDMNPEQFMRWVKAQRNEFPHLAKA